MRVGLQASRALRAGERDDRGGDHELGVHGDLCARLALRQPELSLAITPRAHFWWLLVLAGRLQLQRNFQPRTEVLAELLANKLANKNNKAIEAQSA